MGNRIAELRKARGWSMERLAEAIGTGAPQVSKLEKGQLRLSQIWMQRIATALGCHPAELLDGPPPAAAHAVDPVSSKVLDALGDGAALDLSDDMRVYDLAESLADTFISALPADRNAFADQRVKGALIARIFNKLKQAQG